MEVPWSWRWIQGSRVCSRSPQLPDTVSVAPYGWWLSTVGPLHHPTTKHTHTHTELQIETFSGPHTVTEIFVAYCKWWLTTFEQTQQTYTSTPSTAPRWHYNK